MYQLGLQTWPLPTRACRRLKWMVPLPVWKAQFVLRLIIYKIHYLLTCWPHGFHEKIILFSTLIKWNNFWRQRKTKQKQIFCKGSVKIYLNCTEQYLFWFQIFGNVWVHWNTEDNRLLLLLIRQTLLADWNRQSAFAFQTNQTKTDFNFIFVKYS